jgi:hypothetical protein
MKKKEQYDNFRNSVRSKVTKAIDAIHTAIKNKHFIFKFLETYEFHIRKAGIDFDKLREFNSNDYNSNFYINKDVKIIDDEILNEMLRSNLNNFIYLSYTRIDNLLNYIEHMTFIYNMPYSIYIKLIRNFNTEVISEVLEGNHYAFGHGLSKISIKRGKRAEDKKAVNWKKSNELKQTTGGKGEYIIYHDSMYYYFYYWNKSNCKIANHLYYSFKVNSFINTDNRKVSEFYENLKTVDDIVNEKKIGNFQKMNCMLHLKPEIANLYMEN